MSLIFGFYAENIDTRTGFKERPLFKDRIIYLINGIQFEIEAESSIESKVFTDEMM